MTNRIADTTQQKAAKIAGFAYLLIIVTSLIAMIFGYYGMIEEGNNATTLNNIAAQEGIFRVTAAYNLVMFASVIILTLALYVTLKPVNKYLAMLGVLWRLAEAVLGCVMVLGSLMVLVLIQGQDYAAAFDTAQVQALAGLFLGLNAGALTMVSVFLSLGTIVFFYLFFKANYIPRGLSIFGIAASFLLLGFSLTDILLPAIPESVEALCSMPIMLFEITIGVWLLWKGINTEYWEKRTSESA